jgi:23S rRNA (uracil1939-C5)-methyltransferase
MNRNRPRHHKGAKPQPAREVELTIEKLATEGLGLGRLDGKTVLVADALPGEAVRAVVSGGTGRVIERLSDSSERITPACRHFGTCGGCVLQHLAPEPYQAFKRALVADALARQGLGDVVVAEPIQSPPGSRRRAVLEARRRGKGVLLGFHERAGHGVVDMAECPVLAKNLVTLLPPLRVLLTALLPPEAKAGVVLTLLDQGVDLGLSLPVTPDLAALEALAEFAGNQDLTRLWWQADGLAPVPAAERRPARVSFGDASVVPVMGGFLQATCEGEAALADAVLAALGDLPIGARVADLHAGSGTFALRLAARGFKTHAVEADAAPLAALNTAARRSGLAVTTETRDLDDRPLQGPELAGFEAVVFDPPRAGARVQAEALAFANPKVVVGVSCNPATFARDARILVDGGWRLQQVQPVDQFLWSQHIELVGVFRR